MAVFYDDLLIRKVLFYLKQTAEIAKEGRRQEHLITSSLS
jgi:hypothetical protein